MSVSQRIENAGNRLEKAILPVARVTDYAGMVLIGVLILLTVSEIVLRKVFLTSMPGNMEILALVLGVATCLMLALSEFGRGHISIDMVITKLPPRGGTTINAVMYLLYLAFTSYVTYAMFKYGEFALHSGRVSVRLGIPQYPFYYVMAFCFLILSLMVLAHFLLYIAEVSKK